MQPELTANKLGIIKSYFNRIEHAHQHNNSDGNFERDKELLDMHLAVIDLISICSKNSPYGVT